MTDLKLPFTPCEPSPPADICQRHGVECKPLYITGALAGDPETNTYRWHMQLFGTIEPHWVQWCDLCVKEKINALGYVNAAPEPAKEETRYKSLEELTVEFPAQGEIIADAKQLIDAIKTGAKIEKPYRIYSGPTGTGKTTIARAIIEAAKTYRLHTGQFYKDGLVRELIGYRFGDGSSEQSFQRRIRDLAKYTVILLDDFGNTQNNEHVPLTVSGSEVLDYFINAIYESMRPPILIITTNLTPAQIYKMVSARSLSRIAERLGPRGTALEFGWKKDYRR